MRIFGLGVHGLYRVSGLVQDADSHGRVCGALMLQPPEFF